MQKKPPIWGDGMQKKPPIFVSASRELGTGRYRFLGDLTLKKKDSQVFGKIRALFWFEGDSSPLNNPSIAVLVTYHSSHPQNRNFT